MQFQQSEVNVYTQALHQVLILPKSSEKRSELVKSVKPETSETGFFLRYHRSINKYCFHQITAFIVILCSVTQR